MAYDYNTMKLAAERESSLGTFNGVGVYAIKKEDLYLSPDGRYYIVYDDDNALVKDGMFYGRVSTWGDVSEVKIPRYYAYPEPKRKATVKEREVSVEEVPVKAKEVPLVSMGTDEFFGRIEREIDELLKSDFKFEMGEV